MNIDEYVSLVPYQPFANEQPITGYQRFANEHPDDPPSDYVIHIDDYRVPIHAYSLFYISDPYQQLLPYTDCFTLAQDLRHYYPLQYPFTWFVSYERVAIVSFNDLYMYTVSQRLPRPEYPSSFPYQHYLSSPFVHSNNNNFEEELEDDQQTTVYNGLTKKQIFENLQLTKYYKEKEEEEGEVCVVCLVEFKRNEMLGVLQCKHWYHPKCIKEWLIRHNVCPLCKSQALRVV